MVNRICNPLKSNSFFLFGARGTGKSTLLKRLFSEEVATTFDLLDYEIEESFQKNPSLLVELLKQVQKDSPHKKWVIIDEVQKIPSLLNVVHKLIEEKHFRFALTGSSARKLKRGHANFLAGRAYLYNLYPLTHKELGKKFNLPEILAWGSLPTVFGLDDQSKIKYLKSYTQTYLREEIVAEQLVRNLNPFRSFLEVAAQSSGKIINYSNIAKDLGVEIPTVQSYFEILEDTHVGLLLKPFHESLRKRQRQNPKFYFFDIGVQRALSKRLDLGIQESNYEYGDLFESFVILEIFRLSQYLDKDWTLSYLRTKDDLEVDLIIDRPGLPRAFVEIKSTQKVETEKLTGFKALIKTLSGVECFVLSRDKKEFIKDGISYLPWHKGIQELGL